MVRVYLMYIKSLIFYSIIGRTNNSTIISQFELYSDMMTKVFKSVHIMRIPKPHLYATSFTHGVSHIIMIYYTYRFITISSQDKLALETMSILYSNDSSHTDVTKPTIKDNIGFSRSVRFTSCSVFSPMIIVFFSS